MFYIKGNFYIKGCNKACIKIVHVPELTVSLSCKILVWYNVNDVVWWGFDRKCHWYLLVLL